MQSLRNIGVGGGENVRQLDIWWLEGKEGDRVGWVNGERTCGSCCAQHLLRVNTCECARVQCVYFSATRECMCMCVCAYGSVCIFQLHVSVCVCVCSFLWSSTKKTDKRQNNFFFVCLNFVVCTTGWIGCRRTGDGWIMEANCRTFFHHPPDVTRANCSTFPSTRCCATTAAPHFPPDTRCARNN